MLERLPLDWMRVDDADSNTTLNPILCISGTKAKERNSWVCCLQKCLTVPNSFRPPKVVHVDWFFEIAASAINEELKAVQVQRRIKLLFPEKHKKYT